MASRTRKPSHPPAPAPAPEAAPFKAAYFNRELSWLAFDRRVLEQAQDPRHPLLERVQFLAIVSSNLDEFFEIRVAGLMQQMDSGLTEPGPDGLSPREQLRRIHSVVASLVEEQYRTWQHQLVPALAKEGILFRSAPELSARELNWVRAYFREQVYPVLTPLALDQAHPFPQLGNKTLNIVVSLAGPEEPGQGSLMAILPVPRALPRLVPIAPSPKGPQRFIFLSEIIKLCAGELFPGYQLTSAHAFRVTRNSDLYIDEEEAENLLTKIEEELRNLRRGAAVRLEVEDGIDEGLFSTLCGHLDLSHEYVFRLQGPLNLLRLQSLASLDRPDLRFPPFTPVNGSPLRDPSAIFEVLGRQDVMLYHPYDSFTPVVDFVEQAARDPQVLAIKQTLYRTSGDSPIVRALMEASRNGKQVTALVELRARFDEANNIQWARQLEEAGVARGLRPGRPQDPLQALPGRAPGGRPDAPLRPPRHRQLQPEDRAALHRPQLLHLPPKPDPRRRAGVQRADGPGPRPRRSAGSWSPPTTSTGASSSSSPARRPTPRPAGPPGSSPR